MKGLNKGADASGGKGTPGQGRVCGKAQRPENQGDSQGREEFRTAKTEGDEKL